MLFYLLSEIKAHYYLRGGSDYEIKSVLLTEESVEVSVVLYREICKINHSVLKTIE
jgi:hypothetical protein